MQIGGIERRSRYVPEWNGNRALPENDQVVVHWDNLTWEQRRKHVRASDLKMILKNAGQKGEAELGREVDRQLNEFEQTFTTDREAMAREAKVTIEGLNDAEGKPLASTWEQLCKLPDTPQAKFSALIVEIQNAIVNGAKEPDRKN
jgi:hypothetical protein